MSLQKYTLILLEQGIEEAILFECQAESLPHALEQAHDAYGGSRVTGMEGVPSAVDLMHLGYSIHEDGDQPRRWFYRDREDSGSDISFDSYEEASQAALRDALETLYREYGGRCIAVGDQVWWDDPADGFSSGYYRVVMIYGEVVTIKNEAGSTAEVFPHELTYRRSA